MAKTITQLPDATTVDAADELIIQQGGVTKRATKTEVLNGIVNANVDAAAAIAGTKISPNFGSQDIVTTGRIGAGTTSPTHVLQARATQATASVISSTGTNNALIAVGNDSNQLRVGQEGDAGGTLLFGASAYSGVVGTDGANALSLGTNATERMRVKATGQVRFQPLAADPAGAEAGDVYYNSSSNKLKVYNGSSWVDLH